MYRLGPADHQPGRHRRYPEQDVAVLEAMCRLLGEGVAPTAAAGIARSRATSARSDRHRTGQRIAQLEAAERIASGLVHAALRLDAEFLTGTLDTTSLPTGWP